MLPSSKQYLETGGLSKKAAAWTLIALFLAGAVGIQLLSRVMHHMLPSHVVDCDHTHLDSEESEELESCPDDEESQINKSDAGHYHRIESHEDENTTPSTIQNGTQKISPSNSMTHRRPSLPYTKSMWNTWLNSSTSTCNSPDCYGYTNPCGNCFKNVQASIGGHLVSSRPQISRSVTELPTHSSERTPLLQVTSDEPTSSASSSSSNGKLAENPLSKGTSLHQNDHQHDHHHHVPTNVFLSLGLQTSIAIALHKLPEGFITYATNHANARLGVAVFISLFVHNITEGFALALPLYLALHSRPKAMIWSAILGGVSQPIGAGIAALWFHIAGSADMAPGEAVYGGMFAIVAGIMTSVALQLMGESLELTHDRELCFVFAFIGMGILGASSALTA